MRCFALILTVFFILLLSPAIAAELYQGEDFLGPENFFDIRTYHESHPKHDTTHDRGGWSVGFVLLRIGAQAKALWIPSLWKPHHQLREL